MISHLSGIMLQRTPLLLVLLVGIVFAIVRWKRHPRISFLTLLGLVLYLIKIFSFSALSYAIPQLMPLMHLTYSTVNNLYTLLDVLNDLVLCGIMILLVAVAFSQRRPTTSINN